MSKAIDLTRYKTTPHPLNTFFRQRKISKPVLANYLGISLSRVAFILLGYTPMPEVYEKRLQALADSIVHQEAEGGPYAG